MNLAGWNQSTWASGAYRVGSPLAPASITRIPKLGLKIAATLYNREAAIIQSYSVYCSVFPLAGNGVVKRCDGTTGVSVYIGAIWGSSVACQ